MKQPSYLTEIAGKVRDLRDAQANSVGNDPYMLGLYNGLELALTVIEDRDPVYIEGPPKSRAFFAECEAEARQIVRQG